MWEERDIARVGEVLWCKPFGVLPGVIPSSLA